MNMKNKMKRLGMMASLCVMMSFGFMGKEVRASETTPAAPTFLQMNQEITQSGKYMVTKPGRFEYIGEGYPSRTLYRINLGNEKELDFFYGTDVTTNRYRRVPVGEYKVNLGKGESLRFVEEPSTSFEQENNDSFDTANLIEPNISYKGYVQDDEDESDYFKVDVKSQGSLFVDGSLNGNDIDLVIYKEGEGGNTEELYNGRFESKQIKTDRYRVTKGVYYVVVKYYYKNLEYSLKVNFTPETADAFETEKNDTKEMANGILPNQGYTGNLATVTQKDGYSTKSFKDTDFFKATLLKTGKANLRLQTPRQQANNLFKVELQKADGTVIDTITSSDNPLTKGEKFTVTPGDYYIKVAGNGREDSHVDYNVTLEYEEVILVDKIEVDHTSEDYYKGDKEKLNLSITPTNAADKAVVWESTDPKIATVDQDGEITAVGIGETIVRAKLKSNTNIYGEARIVVKKRLMESLKITAPKKVLEVGESIVLKGIFEPENADEPYALWESMNEEVAEVDQYGLVTANKPGKVSIKILAEDGSGVTESIDLTVNRVKRTNAHLKTLKFSTGKLNKKFSSKRGDYVLTLSGTSKSVKITPVVEDKFAKFTINGKKAKAITVKVGRKKSKTVKIVVTNDDAKKTYKIKVVRK